MIHSKHLKSGMSLIEVMIAIAIFAIFGSSLFVMQHYVFERMMVCQKKIIASLRIQEELSIYQVNILKELYDYEHGSLEKSLEPKEKYFSLPDMMVSITTTSIFAAEQDQKDFPLKDFKDMYLIAAQAQDVDDQEKVYGQLFVLSYIPQLEKPKD